MRLRNWDVAFLEVVHACLADMQVTVVELWADQPKELIPWLEEFVVMAKDYERFFRIRVEAGAEPPQRLNAASRRRLAVEAVLAKAKTRA